MNKDMIQNIFIGVLLGGVILLAGGVYFLAMQVQTASQGIERIEQSVTESMQKMDNAFRCVESGGQYEAGQCDCGSDYFLENGSCMGQDGLTKHQLEEIKAEQERLMEANENAMMRESDDKALVLSEDVSVSPWPLDWEVRADSRDDITWGIFDDQNENVGYISCPRDKPTYWDSVINDENSEVESGAYSRSGVELFKKKVIQRYVQDVGYGVYITAGFTTDEYDSGHGCFFDINTGEDLSEDERGRIDLIYQGIQ